MSLPPLLRVENVTLRYGHREALSGVSFDVAAGEAVGLLGPNGAGKTSLFRILSTQLCPTSGDALIAGSSLRNDYEKVRRKIGVIFQSPALDKKLTARENLVHQARLYGFSGLDLRRRVDEALVRAGLVDRGNDLAGSFSGGMKRRLDLVRGLIHQPELLLLDEPTEGLDPAARRDFWDLLARQRETEKMTIVMATHSMDEAERCDRVGIVSGGQLATIGTPMDLKRQIRGDVVTAETADPDSLARDVEAKFGTKVTVLAGGVRIEREDGAQFVARLAESFPARIDAIRVGRPTLEDVFVHVTGRAFRKPEGTP